LEAEQAVLTSRTDQRLTDIEVYRAQMVSLEQQRAVVGEQLSMRRALLERGLASRLTVHDVQREYARIEGDIAQARANLSRAEQAAEEARRAAAEVELRYRSDAIDELGTAAAELAEINETLVGLQDRVFRREVLAPARGIVNRLAATVAGQVVEPGRAIASLVPTEGGLVIEAQLPPADVGYVAIGQHAEITIDGFEMAQFGTVSGIVTYISPTTIMTEEGVPYYRIRVEPETLDIGRGTTQHQLIPGMVVQASIHTGEQSMLSYLIRPVYRSLAQAFAER
jgi:HlyD family secretion protein/adhesin transport system membrane fusion protein